MVNLLNVYDFTYTTNLRKKTACPGARRRPGKVPLSFFRTRITQIERIDTDEAKIKYVKGN
jgi:hypothetical protein